MFFIEPQKPNDISEIESLLDKSFGKDRHNKTAYRLRDGVSDVKTLSFVIRIDGVLKATIRFWPVLIKDKDKSYDALLLGPIAIDEEFRGKGMGIALIEHSLTQAAVFGASRVILVGDEPFYRKIGFKRSLAEGLIMPGPVDYDRLLAKELVEGSFEGIKGLISKVK